jgi:arabinose-5-phosphate isomerase
LITPPQANDTVSPEEIIQLARATIDQESASVAQLRDQIDELFVKVAQTLYRCEGHILVAGAGTSHAVALRLAHLLSCSGTPALFIHPGDSQHGLAGAVRPEDILIALSKGGETTEVNTLAQIARKRGATVIAFTEKPDSSLGQSSDLILRIQALPGVDPYGMIATGSSLTNAAMGDALCAVLLEMRGYSRDAFGETHPGGAVGKKIEQEAKSNPS